MEFSRLFLNELPTEMADGYAFGNAYNLLGNGVRVDPGALDRLGSLLEDSDFDDLECEDAYCVDDPPVDDSGPG